jgi:predicted ABC-type ATPase
MSEHKPQLWVFAGPNGAGKSTLMRHAKVADYLPVINADDIADSLRLNDPSKHETAVVAQAGREAIKRRNLLLNEKLSFAIETTLTGHSELRLMRDARDRGYEVRLIYVKISEAELSNGRVTLRVRAKGHNVSEQDIMRRFGRSTKNLPHALKASDRAYIFDNSGKQYRLIAECHGGKAISPVTGPARAY